MQQNSKIQYIKVLYRKPPKNTYIYINIPDQSQKNRYVLSVRCTIEHAIESVQKYDHCAKCEKVKCV